MYRLRGGPQPLRIFIGYDPQEPIAYHVLAHSLMRHASGPLSITPLVQRHLREKEYYMRERTETESTEFSLTRFLVPALCDYGGLALFMDCDMLCQGDVYELFKLANKDRYKAVYCVQHDYTPKDETKFLGHVQTKYPRKNWSSVMLFRNKYCEKLTPSYVNTASGLDLHRFAWCPDADIGSLPLEWNWLSDEYEENRNAKLIHFTNGGPWFRDYQLCDHADLWFAEFQRACPSMHIAKPKGLQHAAV
jgi:hypothetical protein